MLLTAAGIFMAVICSTAIPVSAAGEIPFCNFCGQKCRRQILTFRDFTYCSRECFAERHRCHGCGQPLWEGAVSRYDLLAAEHDFCNSCSRYDGCFVCLGFNNLVRLPDSRLICTACEKKGIKTEAEAAVLLDYVRKAMEQFFGLPYDHEITIKVLDQQQMGWSPESGSRKLAEHSFSYDYELRRSRRDTKVKITDSHCTISILSHCPAPKLLASLAHELAHDYLRHNCGLIEDKRLEEGFAETVAACFSEIAGNGALNKARDKNPDPIYGDGYRMVRDYVLNYGWQAAINAMHQSGKALDKAALERHR